MRGIKFCLLIVVIILSSCGAEQVYIPKPRLYPKIEFPQRENKNVDLDFCKFKFDFPDYGMAVQDSYYFDESILDKCWFDIVMNDLNGRIHCSYFPIKNRVHFDELVKDAFELVYKHNVKANYRDEKNINFPDRDVHGVQFEIDGHVASPFQFFLTDSTDHFIRGSLYFNAKVDADSITPVYNFVKKDIMNMIVSFRWKD